MEEHSQSHKATHGTRQEQHLRQEETTAQKTSAVEFQTAEELIRHDAKRTSPPEGLEKRVKESVEREAGSKRRWWHRFLGR
ncbi:MAG TPA: hypothetical protein PLW35_13770 [Verrucomicrobiota bacterium]|nr:hypothetical protein [Verrucomicrobiota bacterium]HOK78772.1 hypothetical protein [Verrucomicrobiota bacterium]